MRIGIIDFGTNTLRLNIFETEDTDYSIIFDEVIYSKIVENTVDGKLSQDGIEHVIQAIEEHLAVCKHFRCDKTECFSTASLRYISNASDVIEQVLYRTGINITMITGEKEAYFDYMALKSIISEDKGVGCDLGGGSLQVFSFDENGPLESASFPFGSSRTYKNFVNGDIPTKEEVLKIFTEVRSELKKTGYRHFGNILYTMGGTAKSIEKIYKGTLLKTGNISKSDLSGMLSTIIENPEESVEFFEDTVPSRKTTITPGICVLLAVMEELECSELEILSVGVREGFLEEKLLDNETNQNILDVIQGLI